MKRRNFINILLCFVTIGAFISCSNSADTDTPESETSVTSVTISGTETEVTAGLTITLTAALNDGATGDITWASSDETIATVDGGVVTGVSAGAVEITASCDEVTSDAYAVTVNASEIPVTSVTISGTETEIFVGGTLTLTAALNEEATGVIAWTSSDETIATVDGGVVTGVSAGAVSITASCDEVTSEAYTVTVNAVPVSSVTISGSDTEISVGGTTTLSATLNDYATGDITWVSSDETVATVDGGVVTGVSAGAVEITASCDGIDSDVYAITINAVPVSSVTISGTDTETVIGGSFTLTATLNDYATGDITWTSSDETIATVADGVVTGIGIGDVEITASCDGIDSDAYTVTVNYSTTLDVWVNGESCTGFVNNSTITDTTDTTTYSGQSVRTFTIASDEYCGYAWAGLTSFTAPLIHLEFYATADFKINPGDGDHIITLADYTADSNGMYSIDIDLGTIDLTPGSTTFRTDEDTTTVSLVSYYYYEY